MSTSEDGSRRPARRGGDARVDVIVGGVFVARDARGRGGARAREWSRVVARAISWDAGPARGGARRRAWERE